MYLKCTSNYRPCKTPLALCLSQILTHEHPALLRCEDLPLHKMAPASRRHEAFEGNFPLTKMAAEGGGETRRSPPPPISGRQLSRGGRGLANGRRRRGSRAGSGPMGAAAGGNRRRAGAAVPVPVWRAPSEAGCGRPTGSGRRWPCSCCRPAAGRCATGSARVSGAGPEEGRPRGTAR